MLFRSRIPEENVKDLQEIPENVKNGLEIIPVRWIDKVLEIALESLPAPLPETDDAAQAAPVAAVAAAAPRKKTGGSDRTRAAVQH